MKIQGSTAAEIFDSVRSQIQSQRLKAGQVLPPVRDLAIELGINRNTVASAYRRLATAGIAITQGRLGTSIRDPLEVGEQEGLLPDTPLTDLASGNPNPYWLPDLNAAFKLKPYQPRLYGEPTINVRLEDYARKWFTPDCPTSFEIDLTHGAVDAVERILHGSLLVGDKVAIEDPCFLSSINTLRANGIQSVGIPIDSEGMLPGALKEALDKGIRAVIITPRAHNPTGCSLSEKRSRALSRVLAKHPNVLVIVDDHFALLSKKPYFSIIPRATQRWALIRSFSKVFGPDMRVAAIASDLKTSQQLRLRLSPGTNWVSHLLQDAIEHIITATDSQQLIADASDDYARRRMMLEQALTQQGIEFLEDGDGLNLWLPLPDADQSIALTLARQGWLVRHGEIFSVQNTATGLRITTSAIEPEQCTRLAKDIKHSLELERSI